MKKFFLITLIFLLTLGLVFGCATEKRVEEKNNVPKNGVNNSDTIDNNKKIVDGDDMNNIGDEESEQEQAKEVAQIAERVEGVRRATVLVTGNIAYVGIDMDSKVEDEKTNEIKDQVAEKIKRDEKSIDQVFVSADADTVTRLQEIIEDIGKGKPVSGFLDELTEMFRRPAPTTK
ncbi:YhcN/YlaJ family sporulation lipoprotein [Garciella nitratireducens]|uniref:Sporulation lipoprotein, YhcN/YlaJ family n=1 Tax=Garciella nitratireducens DSM 15102 TaxID=1121911 RepID=A0A1T4MFJ1_9FIRM|nr:YhcN/YlaJ family sporulation lipoprotein [Garciella nitratireducens]SJZ65635.1 sporulation lipoprotein, YhcN/YlaJ family [Garciella nitratireducens DSM 15102]